MSAVGCAVGNASYENDKVTSKFMYEYESGSCDSSPSASRRPLAVGTDVGALAEPQYPQPEVIASGQMRPYEQIAALEHA